MKMLNVALAAAALAFAATTVGAVTPADAQVSIRTGEHGVGVRIGDTNRHRYQGQHGYYAYGQADCRTITVRKTRPNGTVVVTKTRVCD
jgi:hypothetical protein